MHPRWHDRDNVLPGTSRGGSPNGEGLDIGCFRSPSTSLLFQLPISALPSPHLSLSHDQLELYNVGDATYVTHAVMMMLHALAASSLPVRIARNEVLSILLFGA